MKEKEVIYMAKEKYGDNFTQDQYSAVAETVAQYTKRTDGFIGGIQLENGPNSSVRIIIDGDKKLYADPKNCRHSKTGTRVYDDPPESRITDGNGNSVYGIR